MSIEPLNNINFNTKIIVSYAEKLFFTDKGYFNWIAITSTIAIGTFIWTIWFNNKKYRADLISKARIDWMNQVRTLLAEYLAAVPNYIYLYSKAMVDGDKESKKMLTNKMDEIKRLYYELNLYIPRNSSNAEILKNIDLLWGELDYITPYYNRGIAKNLMASERNNFRETDYEDVVDDYISRLVNKTSTVGSEYFKQEWERAKKGL